MLADLSLSGFVAVDVFETAQSCPPEDMQRSRACRIFSMQRMNLLGWKNMPPSKDEDGQRYRRCGVVSELR